MKFKNFLDEINHHILYGYDINLREIQYILRLFQRCLSPDEYLKHTIAINLILEFTSTQITIDEFTKRQKELELENELNEIKGK